MKIGISVDLSEHEARVYADELNRHMPADEIRRLRLRAERLIRAAIRRQLERRGLLR